MKTETVAGALSAEFTNGEVLTFEGRGGRTFDLPRDNPAWGIVEEAVDANT